MMQPEAEPSGDGATHGEIKVEEIEEICTKRIESLLTTHTVLSSRGSSNRYPISFQRISGYFYIQLLPMDESHDDVLLIGIFHELSHHPK